MKYYLQVNSEDVITDVITYPHEGYVEFEADSIPVGLHGGWWKLIAGELVETVELNPITITNQINQAIDDYTLELIEGGVL